MRLSGPSGTGRISRACRGCKGCGYRRLQAAVLQGIAGAAGCSLRPALCYGAPSPLRRLARTASWRSGYAEDCKSLYAGSIPAEASILSLRDHGRFRAGAPDDGGQPAAHLRRERHPAPRRLRTRSRAERSSSPGREGLAYIDQDLLVSPGPERRFMLAPMVLARMIQALEIEPGMRVLDVPAASAIPRRCSRRSGRGSTALESDGTLAAAAAGAARRGAASTASPSWRGPWRTGVRPSRALTMRSWSTAPSR